MLVFLLFYVFNVNSQEVWQPMYLTTTGHNVIDGVEGWFMQGTCNDEVVVYIRFVNTTNYQAEISWYDGIFTTSKEWVFDRNTKTFLLPAGLDKKGTCGAEEKFVINLGNLNLTQADFMRYTAMELIVVLK